MHIAKLQTVTLFRPIRSLQCIASLLHYYKPLTFTEDLKCSSIILSETGIDSEDSFKATNVAFILQLREWAVKFKIRDGQFRIQNPKGSNPKLFESNRIRLISCLQAL